jgi:lipoate-protein ligase A
VSNEVAELHDYEAIRGLEKATVFTPPILATTIVLGSSQGVELLAPPRPRGLRVGRRRGGGGAVLLRGGDLWVDFWIPAGDPRHRDDVGAAARLVGRWWRDALGGRHRGSFELHTGAWRGDPALRVACFAARGEGEVLCEGAKVVGVTQWRVREGSLVSTVLHRQSTQELATLIARPPAGLTASLHHGSLESLGLIDQADALVDDVVARGGSWQRRGDVPVR